MLPPQQVLRNLYGFFKNSGNFAISTAIRRASSRVSSLAVDCRSDALFSDAAHRVARGVGEGWPLRPLQAARPRSFLSAVYLSQ